MEGKCFLHVRSTYFACVFRVSAAQQAAKTASNTGQARVQASVTVSKGLQQHVAGQSSTRHSMMRQRRELCMLDMAGQGRAGQGGAGQGRAGQGRAGQGRAGQNTGQI